MGFKRSSSLTLRVKVELCSEVIDHQGQAESITPDGIEGAYQIVSIHARHPSNIFWAGKDLEVCLTGEEFSGGC